MKTLSAGKTDEAGPVKAGAKHVGPNQTRGDRPEGAPAGAPSVLGGSFARVQIMPAVWIVRADRPRTYQLGTTYAVFEICFEQPRATVFVLEKAIVIRNNISRLFPAAHLEPATFEQWVEQEAGE